MSASEFIITLPTEGEEDGSGNLIPVDRWGVHKVILYAKEDTKVDGWTVRNPGNNVFLAELLSFVFVLMSWLSLIEWVTDNLIILDKF